MNLKAAISIRWIALLLSLFLLSSCSPARPVRPEHLIMISVDGLVPDYYTAPERVGLETTVLASLARKGAYAEGVEGVYPSVTYPSHTTLVTGVRPAKHGIVQNRIFEVPTAAAPEVWYWFSSDLRADTLWSLAREAGMKTGGVSWPVTVGAAIDYNIPEIWDPSGDFNSPLRQNENTTPGLLEEATAAGVPADATGEERRAALSEFIITAHKPALLLIHLIDLDSAHHEHGPRTGPALEAAKKIDGYLGRIIEATRKAGIYDRTTFFIVSDHGFAAIEKRFEPNVVLAREGLITLDAAGNPMEWKAAAWPAGGSCAIVLKDPADRETAEKVKSVFQPYLQQPLQAISRIVTREELDTLGAIPEALLMLEAAPAFSFGSSWSGPAIRDSGPTSKGAHGYLPTSDFMLSSLVAFGPGIRPGARVARARMIDVAPTVAALLGLQLSAAEGEVIREFLISP